MLNIPRFHILLTALLAATPCGSIAAAGDKPNIVYILADDVGWGSVGCYGADPDLVRTPNIDRLAREGRKFTDANCAASVCSPSRYSILTGRYCWRTSLKFGTLGIDSPSHIEADRPTVASLLKKAGYETAAIGKWHLGFGTSEPDFTGSLRPGPVEAGFGYFYGVPSNHGDRTGVYLDTQTETDNGSVVRIEGLKSKDLEPFGPSFYGKNSTFYGFDAPQRVDAEVMPHLTEKATSWIADREPGKPFFLYFAPVAVHEPVTPSAATTGTSKAGPYGDWIHELDRSVGAILDELDRLELADDTLVIFTSDNGGEDRYGLPAWGDIEGGSNKKAVAAGLKINGDWRSGKASIFEGGLRAPFVARWPGRVPAGTVSDEPISLIDTLSTLVAAAGAEPPRPDKGAEDSHNVLPAILGDAHLSPIRPAMIGHSRIGVFSVRKGEWKWIEGKSAIAGKPGKPMPKHEQVEMKPQLYNLADDPQESRNVIADHPEIAAELSVLLERYRHQGHSRIADVGQ
jgi:arylsulfatase A